MKNITFQKVIPHPIKEGFKATSTVWLSDIDFIKNKKYMVTAPSGRGKSTFLHIIYGLRKDYDGKVMLDNQDVKNNSLNKWAEIRQTQLSIVFQNLRLFPQLTGLENIQVKNQLSNTKTSEQVEMMAERLGVKDILQQEAGTMSYGQRQRIAIIRALCQPFSFLLLDEPFSHLDENNIEKACTLIKEEIEANQAGLLLVSLGEPYAFQYDETIVL